MLSLLGFKARSSAGRTRKDERHRSKLARAARWLVLSLVGAEVLYLVAANGFLAFGGVPRLFTGTRAVEADVASAWTVFPGFIHARGLQVTVQDHNVQSVIQMDRVQFRLSLHELPSRVFHATKVRGSGVVFRFRNRVQPEGKDHPSVRALPPIPGFEDPPVYESWVPEPPIPDALYDLWTVHLEDVDVLADELWVQQLRYLGRARAVGAFELKPARRLWVGPASLAVEPGRIVVAGRDAFTAFSGKIECTVHPFDVRVPDGFAVLRYISTRTTLHGDIRGGELAELFLPAGTRIEPMGARLAIDAVLDRGVLAASSRVALEGDSLQVRAGELSADVTSPWSVVGTGDGGGGGGRVVATVPRVLVARDGHAAPVTIRDAIAGASSTGLDTAVPWAMRGADLTLGELVAPDLRVLNDVRLGEVRFRGGAGVAHGRVAYEGRTLSGKGAVVLRQAVMNVSDTELRGNASLDATMRAFDERQGTGSFDLTFHGSELRTADISDGVTCPWGNFGITQAEAHLSLLPNGRASGKIDASIDGAKLTWGDVRVSGNTDLRVTIEPEDRAEGDGSRVLGTLRAFQVRIRTGSGPPKRWNADIPHTILDASLDLRDGLLDGPIRIATQRAHAAIGNVSMRADVLARLHVAPLDVSQRSGTVRGTVAITKASFSSGSRRIEGWWAKMGVGPTRVVAGRDLELDGRVSGRFRDGLPGLLALSESDEIPGFIADLLPLHGLVGTLDVRRHCRLTDIRLSRIAGGPLVARGRVQNVPGETRGAVLVGLSGLELVSAGIGLGKHGSGVSLFAGDDWLKGQMVGLGRAAALAETRPCVPSRRSACESKNVRLAAPEPFSGRSRTAQARE